MTNSNKEDRTLVLGGFGMVGRAISHQNFNGGFTFVNSLQGDLTNPQETFELFRDYRPDKVIHLAAKVGGLAGNMSGNAEFYERNILINTNVLKTARAYGCKSVVSLLSTCIYPHRDSYLYPLKEEELHDGPPHSSNFGYAYAKRILEVQSRAYNMAPDAKTRFICAVPNNIYGTDDNFCLTEGHVAPAVVRKLCDAHLSGERTEVEFWGDGSPLREFTSANDIAKALIFISENATNPAMPETMNIGTSSETPIWQLVKTVRDYLDNHLISVKWNANKPMGQMRKPSDNTKWLKTYKDLTGNDFQYQSLDSGLKEVVDWYIEQKKHGWTIRGVK